MRRTAAKIIYGFRNLLIDLRFGAPLFGVKVATVPGQANVVNGDYSLYDRVFAEIEISERDVVVDIGAGRGRFINWMLLRGYKNKIVGVEYDAETAQRASRRLSRYKNVQIVNADATQFVPADGTFFFL